ncbi:TIGR01906 family membrane protein [Rothia sp. ZJ932]|uniref:TIGR01906 family membrane protein n=1 Tax=Rothia sp. ZJ932 TaxID=2810516 RepID=UPI001966EF63|nr:TIGR01906 family membrane protein [Rothia sp. ZJ932]QRZ61220.1 TIGR01906 family membrane protein [Rothia sp. ZJ932]
MAEKEPLEPLAGAERDWDDLTPAIDDNDEAVAQRATADRLLRARRVESGLDSSEPTAISMGSPATRDAPVTGVSKTPVDSMPLPEVRELLDESVAVAGEGSAPTLNSAADETEQSAPVAAVAATEAEERASARELAVEDRPRWLKLRQFLMGMAVPVLTLALAVRVVASSAFLWFAYHRPGFPADTYGMNTEERMRLGSYGLDYILNFAPASYLGALRNEKNVTWFLPSEVEHMTDVKVVMLIAMTLAMILGLVAWMSSRTLKERAAGAVRRSLFAGSWATLALMAALGTLAFVGWERFFENFHHVFFPQGNWQFHASDTLIRLYPPQFWVDAGIAVALITLAITLLIMMLTWPTKLRKAREEKVAADRLELRRKLSSSVL